MAADAELADRIRTIHEADRTQGVPRITAELNDGARHRRGSTASGSPGSCAPTLWPGCGYAAGSAPRSRSLPTRRCPTCCAGTSPRPAPNQRYVGDITYLPIADGSNLYLATVIDCFSRRLAGWAIAEHMRTDLVTDALAAARATRGSLAGAIFHSDHGAQAVQREGLRRALRRLGVTQSMGAVGTSADNALAESFNASLKRETLQGAHAWPDEATCRRAVFGWVNRYNTAQATGGVALLCSRRTVR